MGGSEAHAAADEAQKRFGGWWTGVAGMNAAKMLARVTQYVMSLSSKVSGVWNIRGVTNSLSGYISIG